jgi:hypothetical protein
MTGGEPSSKTAPHSIIYASPRHDAILTVECSCGWTIVLPPSESGYGEAMMAMAAQWLEHVGYEGGANVA